MQSFESQVIRTGCNWMTVIYIPDVHSGYPSQACRSLVWLWWGLNGLRCWSVRQSGEPFKYSILSNFLWFFKVMLIYLQLALKVWFSSHVRHHFLFGMWNKFPCSFINFDLDLPSSTLILQWNLRGCANHSFSRRFARALFAKVPFIRVWRERTMLSVSSFNSLSCSAWPPRLQA